MVQGGKDKLKKKQASSGALKKKAVTKINKGKLQFTPKGRKANDQNQELTKSINQKNEKIISSRAVSSGSKFFMADLGEGGVKELEKNLKKRDKKETKGSKSMDIRMKEQLKAL